MITKPSYWFLLCTAALTLLLGAPSLRAQDSQGGTNQQHQRNGGGRQRNGNFDPAQFQQRMMDRYKERLDITDDAEWKAIQPLIQKVMDARMAIGGGRGFGRGGRGNGGNPSDQNQNQNQARRPSNPAAEQLQKAIDDKASAAEIKESLAKYQAYGKEKEAELEKAQAALRKVLSSRQEAIASLSGLL